MTMRSMVRLTSVLAALGALLLSGSGAAGAAPPPPQPPNLGTNVLVFDPSMSTAQIQAAVDAVAAQQVDNEFGSQRYALLFKPGTYGTATQPLTFQVGYYTEVAGLGASPTDVTINGHVDVYNRCLTPSNCLALVNFWRSLSNLTVNVAGLSDCRSSADFWAVSQAAPMRRVKITGANVTLFDYCTAGPQYSSGGFISDSDLPLVINGSQQQFLVRNSSVGFWTNGVWNQVFSGVLGAPDASGFPSPPYTTLATSPVTRERPFLTYAHGTGYRVCRAGCAHQLVRHDLGRRADRGNDDPDRGLLRREADRRREIPQQRACEGAEPAAHAGRLPPRPESRRQAAGHGRARARIPDARSRQRHCGGHARRCRRDQGRRDPRRRRAEALARLVRGRKAAMLTRATRPIRRPCSDVFFRIGGAAAGKATTALVVNSDDVILDDIWAWRADHGNGVGWTTNPADTGVIVNGDDVTAYRPLRRALPEDRGDLERRARAHDLLPERDAVRRARPGVVAARRHRSASPPTRSPTP